MRHERVINVRRSREIEHGRRIAVKRWIVVGVLGAGHVSKGTVDKRLTAQRLVNYLLTSTIIGYVQWCGSLWPRTALGGYDKC